MERNLKISIPEPCHEKWDEMMPKDNGRFCMNCSKTVVDFTTMLPEEIRHYFIQNQDKGICGRFKKSQLDTITIQIPNRVLYTQTQYHKMFLLALFIVMGTTLFSCADKDGNKKKIDKVEVVEDTSDASHVTVGIALPPKHDPNGKVKHVPPPPPPPKVDHIKFIKPVTATKNTKALNSKSIHCESIPKTKKDSTTYYETGILVYTADNKIYQAEYPGGKNKFYTSFKKNFVIPEKAAKVEGELELSFDINVLGKMDNIKVLKDLGEGMSEEGIRVLRSLARWMPARQNGKALTSTYTVKILFDRDIDLDGLKTIESQSQIVSVELNQELE